MQNKITDKKQVASTDMINATNEVDKWWPKISLYALDALDKLYQPIVKAEADAELALDQQALDEATASAKKPLSDQRSRTVNPGSPKDSTVSPSSKDSTTSSSDNEGKRGNP
jgi:hypothetical protein